jgi:hypothetical protein
MSDPFHDPAFEKEVRDEFLRIGVQGVNIGGPFTPEQLLEALRLTPDGAGGHVFFSKLRTLLGDISE